MDFATRACVLRLREGDAPLSCEAIATHLGISESSVRRIIQAEAADHKAGVQRLMRTGNVEQVENWAKANRVQAKKGYFQGAQAWLQATEAIAPKPTVQANVNVTPTVVLNMPFGLGALKDYQPETPAIEAQVVPQLPAKETP